MAVNSGNGWCKFSIGTQNLVWNTGVANVFTSDPVDADGARLTGEDLAAVTVEAGDTVGDGYDTTYWTFGEGPVECVLITAEDEVVYNGSPFFRAEGTVVEVHPTQAQIESGRIGDGVDHADYVTETSLGLSLSGYVAIPAEAPEITGAQGTDDTTILVAVLGVLEDLGLIIDSTTSE
jgi:hypothetical protein